MFKVKLVSLDKYLQSYMNKYSLITHENYIENEKEKILSKTIKENSDIVVDITKILENQTDLLAIYGNFAVDYILPAVKFNTNIKSVDLKNITRLKRTFGELTNKDVSKILENVFFHSFHVKHFNIANIQGLPKSIGDLLDLPLKLLSLSIENCSMMTEHFLYLLDKLSENNHLQCFEYSFSGVSEDIGTKRGEAIKDLLIKNTTLKYFIMRGCQISDEEAVLLGEGLTQNKSLENVYLQSNKIQNKGGTAIGKALMVHPTLELLNLQKNEIGDDAIEFISKGIEKSNSLKNLDLARNYIDDYGGMLISQVLLNSNLETLTIYGIEEEQQPSIPYDITLEYILPYLGAKDICSLSETNKYYNSMVGENNYLWKKVFENEFAPIHQETEKFVKENEDDIIDFMGLEYVEELRLDHSKPFKKICLDVLSKVEQRDEIQEDLNYYRIGGSGLGIYERAPTLSVEKIKDKKIEITKESLIMEESIKTPLLGVNSLPFKIGNMKHLFQAPLIDPDGHNCWLNALLVFIGSNSFFISKLFDQHFEQDSLGDSLKSLYNYWMKYHGTENFREEFNRNYGKVWLNIQRLGYQYGYDFSVIKVFNSIIDELNFKSKDENFMVVTNRDDKVSLDEFEFKSCISHEVLAHTKENLPIGHFTCFMKNENGMFYYDDILQMNDDIQGGMILEEFQPQNIQLSLFIKKHKEKVFPETFKEGNDEKEIFEIPKNEEMIFNGNSNLSLDEVLHILHLIRFSVEFDSLDSLTFGTKRMEGKTHQSEEKKKNLIKREIEFISKNSIHGMYLIAKSGVFDSLISIPNELTIKVDLIKGLRNYQYDIFSFLEEFSKYSIMKKKRRKWRKVDLREIILTQLFFGKKEIKKMKKIQ
eukprot:gene10069-2490_t